MPRKRYRPRPIGRPVGKQMRSDLVLPMHLALVTLRTAADREALRQAWHDLMLPIEAWRVACADRPEVARVLSVASRVLSDIWDRQAKSWRPSGVQLQALTAAVAVCDDVLPYLRTDQIRAGLVDVARRLELV